jgi:hypothetical protein
MYNGIYWTSYSKRGGPPVSQEHFTKILDKLVESFEDFKERLIRIEESVKDVKSVKHDVEQMKIEVAALRSSVSSAHKRIDSHDEGQKWLWRTVGGTLIIGGIGLLFFVVQVYIKG